MILKLSVLLLVATVAWGQKPTPKPCCFPAQWEGKAISGAADSMHGSVGILMPELAVDFTGGQFAVHELIVPRGGHHHHHGGHHHHHHDDDDYNDMYEVEPEQPEEVESGRPRVFNVTSIGHVNGNDSVMYIVLWEHQKCITKHFRAKAGKKKHCIPDKAKYGGSVTIGGDKGVKVDRWVMSNRGKNETDMAYDIADYIDDFLIEDKPRPRPHGFAAASIVVSSKSCFPVSEHVMKADRKSHAVMGTMFFDLKSGIKDPSVFKPPSFCKKADGYEVVENMELTPLVQYFVDKFN